MTETNHAIVLASGGMVSAVTACLAQVEGNDLTLIHVSYDQDTEEREYRCVTKIAAEVGGAEVVSVVADYLNSFGRGAIDRRRRRLGEDPETTSPSGYLPFRDANLLGMGVSYAESHGADSLFIGSHPGDEKQTTSVPQRFFEAYQEVIDFGTPQEIDLQIRVPFSDSSRPEIVERGLEVGTPFEVTWNCHRESPPACGECVACRHRLAAFDEVGAEDPLQYEDE